MTSTRRSTALWSTASFMGRSDDGSYSTITEFKPDWTIYVGFGSLFPLIFVVGLDAFSLGTSISTIASTLDMTTGQSIWAVIAPNLTSTIFSLVFVSFSSIFGRKTMMLLAMLFFAGGGILASFSTGDIMFIAGRAIQGVGGGSIVVLSEIFITGFVPRNSRAVWFGTVNLLWTLGAASGPVIAGLLAKPDQWRFIFRIGPVFCILPAFFVPFLLKFQVRNKVSIVDELVKYDWVGLCLFIGSFVNLLLFITMGGTVDPWTSWRIILHGCASLIAAISFVIYESFYCHNPFVKLYLCNRGTVAITFLCTYLHGFILWSLLFYLPLYYEAVKGFGPVRSGIALFPETITMAVISLIAGIITARTGRYKWSNFIGWIITTLGVSFFMLLDRATVAPIWICLNIVVGFGLGILLSGMAASVHAISNELAQSSSFAISMLYFFRYMGGTTGLAACSTIFQYEMRKSIRSVQENFPKLAEQASQFTFDAVRTATTLDNLPKDEMSTRMQGFADGLQKVWLGLCVVAVVGTLSCVFAKEFLLKSKKEKEQSWNKLRPTAHTDFTPNETPSESRRVSNV